MNHNAYHSFWQQRCSKEKKAMANHLKSVYTDRGAPLRLSTPTLWDSEETAAEALHGFYRARSSPSLTSKDGVMNGHITLPKRMMREPSTVGSASVDLCSQCARSTVSIASRRTSGGWSRSQSQPRSMVSGLSGASRTSVRTVNSELKDEVNKIVQEQMNTVVRPLQEQLKQAEMARERAERQLTGQR
mmetsp:Transcript_27149/g.61316  ORF Transcript_27149/g.61316 Transcript_27149/m.61316 type:complete len:188 (+) Transcript_27149:47-610(+)